MNNQVKIMKSAGSDQGVEELSRKAVIAVLTAAVLIGLWGAAGAACLPDPGKPILVVSDSLTSRQLIKNMLRQIGIDRGRIQEGGDGPAAMRMSRSTAYGLVIIDWSPNGRVAPFIQEIHRYGMGGPPVLALVSLSSFSDAAMKAGAAGCLAKPYNTEILGRTLHEVFCPLSNANLQGKDFSNANLLGADLSGSNLQGANMSGVDLTGAAVKNRRKL